MMKEIIKLSFFLILTSCQGFHDRSVIEPRVKDSTEAFILNYSSFPESFEILSYDRFSVSYPLGEGDTTYSIYLDYQLQNSVGVLDKLKHIFEFNDSYELINISSAIEDGVSFGITDEWLTQFARPFNIRDSINFQKLLE